jgi:hypothetical protein
MAREAPVFGALMVGLLLAASGAGAKTARYEIEGQRYTYSTNNLEQVAVARERMEAARAAADARAKAEAERSANPLLRAFGSQAQRDAAAADAKLRETLAGNTAQEPSPAPRVRRAPAREVAREERKAPARPSAQVDRREVHEPVNTGSLVGPEPATRPNRAAPQNDRPVPAAPRVEAVVFDFASGIRTMHMADGSVDEDVFDRSMAASLKRAQRSGGPRISFVNEGAEAAAPAEGAGPSRP